DPGVIDDALGNHRMHSLQGCRAEEQDDPDAVLGQLASERTLGERYGLPLGVDNCAHAIDSNATLWSHISRVLSTPKDSRWLVLSPVKSPNRSGLGAFMTGSSTRPVAFCSPRATTASPPIASPRKPTSVRGASTSTSPTRTRSFTRLSTESSRRSANGSRP